MKLFISTADESDDVPKVDKDQPTIWQLQAIQNEWSCELIHQVLVVRISQFYFITIITCNFQAAAEVQEAFSAEYYPPYGGFFLFMRLHLKVEGIWNDPHDELCQQLKQYRESREVLQQDR